MLPIFSRYLFPVRNIVAFSLFTSMISNPAFSGDENIYQIKAEPLSELSIVIKHEAVAAVRSLNSSQLASEIAAIVMSVYVDVGDTVVKGTPLLSLDCKLYDISLLSSNANDDAAAARLLLAKTQLKSAQKLAKESFLPGDTLSQRQAQYQMAVAEKQASAAQTQRAQLDVSHCDILAPFDAAVVERLAQEGEYLGPGMPVLRLLDTGSIQVIARIAPKDVTSIESAVALKFHYQNKDLPLELTRLSNFVAEKTGTYTARLVFSGDAADIGVQGRLQWTDSAQYLPSHLLVSREGELGVFVVKGQSVTFVKLPYALEGRPAKTTLEANALIVTHGRGQLHDGDRVEVISTGKLLTSTFKAN